MRDIRIEVTNKCNYNCMICPRKGLSRALSTMSFDLFKLVWDKIKCSNVGDWVNDYLALGEWERKPSTLLTISGMGESLSDNKLEDKIRYAKQSDVNVLLFTNGFMLTLDRFLELQRAGVDAIRVSFHGYSPKEYARVHGVPESFYYDVKEQLEEISRIKTTTKLLMILDYVSEDWKQWVEYWEPKADLVEVWRPHNWVSAMCFRTVQAERVKTCRRPFAGPIQVQCDGTVNMCCFDWDGKLSLGDLKKQSLEEIFQAGPIEHIRECHTSGEFKNSGLICERCDQRNADKTGVLVYSSKFTENRVNLTYQPR